MNDKALPKTLDNLLKLSDKFIVVNEKANWENDVHPDDWWGFISIQDTLKNCVESAIVKADDPRNEMFIGMTDNEKQDFMNALNECLVTLKRNREYLDDLNIRRKVVR